MLDPKNFKTHADPVISWIDHYLKHITDFPVKSQVAPGEIYQAIPGNAPEVPEAMEKIMEDLDKNIEVLRQLRERGVSLSLDDFGTGYSSLSYLKRFPVDTLKIDKSFVEDLHNSSDDAAITQAIIDMAHSLKMKVVAEGVEEDAQMSLLRRMGCDAIQGYLISRPVPEPDFLKLLKSSRQATG